MAHQIIWTSDTLERFIKYGNLTPDQEQIMRTRVAGWPRSRQCMAMNISTSTLDRMIRQLKRLYDETQKQHPDELPQRKASAKELWMDTH